jgi:GNAT superfamily N-acetyltransferase
VSLRYERVTGERAGMDAVQAILGGATDYFQRISGLPPDDAEAESLFSALPPGWGPDRYADKHVLLAYDGATPVAVLDLVRGHPDDKTAFLGLLVVATPRQGTGRAVAAHAEELARTWGCTRVRLAVVRTNPAAIAFWEALGYRATGETRPHRMGRVTSESLLLEKAVGA